MICAIVLLYLVLNIEDKLEKYITSVAIWMLMCFSMTEILSVFCIINIISLRVSWGLINIILLFIGVLKKRRQKIEIHINISKRSILQYAVVFVWGIFVVYMVRLALNTIPYNWDSMTYHLARIVHWVQNGSVKYYATSIDRQVASPIGAAYVILQVYVLSGYRDNFVNLLQCMAFLTNGVFVYFIARKLGCLKQYSILAVILFYTMPIAFGEALSTQVDNFSTLWMLSTVYVLIDLLHKDRKLMLEKVTFERVIVLSLCVAFGYLTKPSVGVGLLLFAVWLLVICIIRRDSMTTIGIYIMVSLTIMGILLFPQLCRNIHTFQAFSAPNVGARQLVGTLNPRYLLVNFIKVFTFNLPTILIPNSKEYLYNLVTKFSGYIDVEIDNPAIAEDGNAFLVHNAQNYGHDSAINPIITYLLLFCIIIFLLRNIKYHFEIKNCYFTVATVSFLVFCMVLRWEQFVSRYMLSYLAVLCPAVVGQLQLLFDNNEYRRVRVMSVVTRLIICMLCIGEMDGLLKYHNKVANKSNYCIYDKDLNEIFYQVKEKVINNHYETIGYMCGGNSYEYPLFVELKDDISRMEHVNVKNKTSVYEDDTYIPDLIISFECGVEDEIITCHGVQYILKDIVGGRMWLYEQIQ